MSKRKMKWEKLQQQPNLKKSVASVIADDIIKKTKEFPSRHDIMMYGYKERPLMSYSEKDLIRMFDEIFVKKRSDLQAHEKELNDLMTGPGYGSVGRWKKDNMRSHIETIKKEIEALKLIEDALIEEAFSE